MISFECSKYHELLCTVCKPLLKAQRSFPISDRGDKDIFQDIFIYLSESEFQRYKQRSSLYWFTPHMATNVQSWASQSQKPGIPSDSHLCDKCPSTWISFHYLPRGTTSELVQKPGLEVVFIRDASMISCGLMHCRNIRSEAEFL